VGGIRARYLTARLPNPLGAPYVSLAASTASATGGHAASEAASPHAHVLEVVRCFSLGHRLLGWPTP
jgi:hypothetical protein